MKRGMAVRLGFCLFFLSVATAHADFTALASVKSDLVNPNMNGYAARTSLSGDGRYVVFESFDTNLVDGDTNGAVDVFRHDRKTGETIRVSVASDGSEALVNATDLGNASRFADVSDDGNIIVFSSYAVNLVPNDDNKGCDIFVRDVVAATTTRISSPAISPGGALGSCGFEGGSISGDGRYVAYYGYTTSSASSGNIIIHDRLTSMDETVPPNSSTIKYYPKISADGRFVTFESYDPNLVPGDTGTAYDVFVYDRNNPVNGLSRVSISSNGVIGDYNSTRPEISRDGRFVVFESFATNLVPGLPGPAINAQRIFVRDRLLGTTELINIPLSGIPDTSSFGERPGISDDGRYVTFQSSSSSYVLNDTNGSGFLDCFKYDRLLHKMSIESSRWDGLSASGTAFQQRCDISGDGTTVAFSSSSKDLVANLMIPSSPATLRVYTRGPIYEPWQDLGNGLAGAFGQTPVLHAEGPMQLGKPLALSLLGKPNTSGALIVGVSQLSVPLYGGTLIPAPDIVLPISLDSQGRGHIVVPWNFSVPAGVSFWMQAWYNDVAGPQGKSATNALKGTIQ